MQYQPTLRFILLAIDNKINMHIDSIINGIIYEKSAGFYEENQMQSA